MTIASINAANAPTAAPAKTGFAALGQGDFLKLMTEQLKQQDPLAPVDNKEMLAQMAQFSSLAGISTVNDTLKAISNKLDAMLARGVAPVAPAPAPAPAPATIDPASPTPAT